MYITLASYSCWKIPFDFITDRMSHDLHIVFLRSEEKQNKFVSILYYQFLLLQDFLRLIGHNYDMRKSSNKLKAIFLFVPLRYHERQEKLIVKIDQHLCFLPKKSVHMLWHIPPLLCKSRYIVSL